MDHNLEPQHDEDKHSATLGHAMPVRMHTFTQRAALYSHTELTPTWIRGRALGSLCSLHEAWPAAQF